MFFTLQIYSISLEKGKAYSLILCLLFLFLLIYLTIALCNVFWSCSGLLFWVVGWPYWSCSGFLLSSLAAFTGGVVALSCLLAAFSAHIGEIWVDCSTIFFFFIIIIITKQVPLVESKYFVHQCTHMPYKM